VILKILAVTLLFTLPTTGQHRWVDPNQGADSVMVECSGGDSIHFLSTAFLHRYPLTGGGWRVSQQHIITAFPGDQDSFVVTGTGHFYVTTANDAGESCPSNVVYIPGSVTTGVEPEENQDPHAVRIELFDVTGRLVRGPLRSGIYFRRTTYADGTVATGRIVHLK